MDGKHVVITHAKRRDDGRQPVAPCSFGSACRRADSSYFAHPKNWDARAGSRRRSSVLGGITRASADLDELSNGTRAAR